MTPDLGSLIGTLTGGQVQFILAGGVAAAVHGAARATYDLDIVYARTSENIARLVAALDPLHPYLRGAPPGLPFRFDADTVTRGLNFALPPRSEISTCWEKSPAAVATSTCCRTRRSSNSTAPRADASPSMRSFA